MSGGLYGIDDTELMGAEDKLPLEGNPVISALDCPSLSNANAFSLLADDSHTAASIFVSPTSPPVLGESVLQDNSFGLNSGSDSEQEEMETQSSKFQRPLTEPAPDQPPSIQLHPAVSPTASPEASLTASAEISPAISPVASSPVPPEVFPAVSPASSPALPAISSEASMTAPVTSPQGSPEPSPAAAFQTVSPASKDISSAPEACADQQEMSGEAVTVSGGGECLHSVPTCWSSQDT